MQKTYYKSVETGEITDSRREAMEWYSKNGESIEVFKNDRRVVTINFLGI